MEQTAELLRVIEETRNGYWIPAAIVGGMSTIILALAVFILRGIIKSNNKRHLDNEKILAGMAINQTDLKIIVAKLEERTKDL